MSAAHARVWFPRQSPVRIEYSAGLLREVRLESATGNGDGVLFGVRHGDQVRVVAARRAPDPKDPRLAGLDPVGIFAVRIRGEVFLTEPDLERFEKNQDANAVALVLAGTKGGFFVREAGGSIQTIKSYQEFSLAETEPAKPKCLVEPPKFLLEKPRARLWPWFVLGCSGLAAIAVMASPYLRPLLPSGPLGLKVHPQAEQLRIQWNPNAVAQHASLEIIDGALHITIPLPFPLTNATYTPSSGDVEIRLIVPGDRAQPRTEMARFVGYGLPVLPMVGQTRSQIASLEEEARALRSENQINRIRLAELDKLLLHD